MITAATSVRRKPLLAVLAALLVAGASLLLLLGGTRSAIADHNANNTDCRGHVEKGEPSPDDPRATQVKYVFACSGPITGYQIQPQIPAQSIDTEVFALDRDDQAGRPHRLVLVSRRASPATGSTASASTAATTRSSTASSRSTRSCAPSRASIRC